MKTFNYFRVSEHLKDGVYTAQGLLDLKDEAKPAYNVYKYIDTNISYTYANKYLKYISYKRNGKTQVSVANGKIKSWKDTMTVYSVTAKKKAFTISYLKSRSAKKYEISYKVKGSKKWSSVKTKSLNKTIKGLKAKKTYQVRVRALDVKGKGASKYSKTYQVKSK